MQDAARFILMYVVLPAWIAAGLADWHCHRRTGIAVTSGLPENLLHWLMYAQMAAAMAAVVLFELNAAVLALVAGAFLSHEATVYWDLHYSTIRRDVGPWEQMAHSFLELLPLLSLALLALMAWPQALAIVRLGEEAPDWALRMRQQAWLPLPYLAAALAATFLLNVLPLAQETASCLRARAPRARRHALRTAQPRSPDAPGGQESQAPGPDPRRNPRREPHLEPHLEPRIEPRLEPQPAPKARTPASPAPK
jgi:hypothetical protein